MNNPFSRFWLIQPVNDAPEVGDIPNQTVQYEEEFVQLNYHEIKDLYIPYKDYWDYTRNEGATSLNLKKDEEKVKVVEADPHNDLPVDKDTQKFFVETIRLYTSSHCPWKCGFCSSHSFLRMVRKF